MLFIFINGCNDIPVILIQISESINDTSLYPQLHGIKYHDDLREFKFKGEVKMEISSLAQNQQRALCHYRSFLVLRNLISCRS